MIEYFGRVQNAKMELNNAGWIVQDRIKWLEKHFEYIKIIKSIVMPNHVHFIIQIIDDVGTGRDLSDIKIRTTRELSLRKSFRKIKSIPENVGALKTTSSKLIHQIKLPEFCWQRSFYDRIIRNDNELIRISDYIEKNPMLWKQDEYIIGSK